MAEYRVTVNEELIPVLEAMAKLRGLASVEAALSAMIEEWAEEVSLENDSLVGFLDGGPDDLSERDEEYLYRGWQPD